MKRALEKRLEQRLQVLEAKIVRRQADGLEAEQWSTQNFVRTAIGCYLGEPQPNEKPCEAIARGLGYKDTDEFHTSLCGNYDDFCEKWRQAVRRLFAQFGVGSDGDRKGHEDALDRMEAGLSVSFQEEFWRSNLESIAMQRSSARDK